MIEIYAKANACLSITQMSTRTCQWAGQPQGLMMMRAGQGRLWAEAGAVVTEQACLRLRPALHPSLPFFFIIHHPLHCRHSHHRHDHHHYHHHPSCLPIAYTSSSPIPATLSTQPHALFNPLLASKQPSNPHQAPFSSTLRASYWLKRTGNRMNGNHPSGPYPPTSQEHKGAFLPRSNRLQLLLTFFKTVAERFWQQTSRQFCHQASSANIWHGRAISLIHCIPQNRNKSYVKYRNTIAGSLNCRRWQKIKYRNSRFILLHKMAKKSPFHWIAQNVTHQNIIGSLNCKNFPLM